MVDYNVIQDPCFVCKAEDALGEPRGTQSHPINCGWKIQNKLDKFLLDTRETMDYVREKRGTEITRINMNPDLYNKINEQLRKTLVPHRMVEFDKAFGIQIVPDENVLEWEYIL